MIKRQLKSSNFYLTRGILFFYLGRHKKASADFSKALRVDWRNERVVLWLDRADRAHRATLLRQDLDGLLNQGATLYPLSVWDRPTCHRFAFAGI